MERLGVKARKIKYRQSDVQHFSPEKKLFPVAKNTSRDSHMARNQRINSSIIKRIKSDNKQRHTQSTLIENTPHKLREHNLSLQLNRERKIADAWIPPEKILSQKLGMASPKHDYSDYLHSSRSSSLTEKRMPSGRIRNADFQVDNIPVLIKPFSVLELNNSHIESSESEEEKPPSKLELIRITSRDTMVSMHSQLKAKRAEEERSQSERQRKIMQKYFSGSSLWNLDHLKNDWLAQHKKSLRELHKDLNRYLSSFKL